MTGQRWRKTLAALLNYDTNTPAMEPHSRRPGASRSSPGAPGLTRHDGRRDANRRSAPASSVARFAGLVAGSARPPELRPQIGCKEVTWPRLHSYFRSPCWSAAVANRSLLPKPKTSMLRSAERSLSESGHGRAPRKRRVTKPPTVALENRSFDERPEHGEKTGVAAMGSSRTEPIVELSEEQG